MNKPAQIAQPRRINHVQQSEAEILRDCLAAIPRLLPKCLVWRQNQGQFEVEYKSKTRIVRMSSLSGLPDICCIYQGRFIGFEIKKPGNKTSETQERTHWLIRDAGGIVYVIYSLEQLVEACEEIKNLSIKKAELVFQDED